MVDTITTNNLLTSLGLTQNEMTLYRAYLQHGEKSAAGVARLIQMDKSSAYRAVENLEKKRLLIKNLKKRGTTYRAVDPGVLNEVYSSVKSSIESKKSEIDQLINDLKKERRQLGRSTYITIEEGIASWQYRMNESLQSKNKLIREKFSDKFLFFNNQQHNRFIVGYAKERVKNNIHILQLEDNDWHASSSHFGDLMINQKKHKKEIRLLPKDIQFGENSFRIWDDTVNIVSEDERQEFIVITIKDKYAIRLMESMYDFIWGKSMPVRTPGVRN